MHSPAESSSGDRKALYEEAVAASERGWATTPLNGKTPVLKAWTSRQGLTADEIADYISRGHNLGVLTGEKSGVVVLDIDWLPGAAREALVDRLPATWTVRSGGGGLHLYYLAPGFAVSNSSGTLLPKVDVKGDGGQIVLPGSVHPDTGEHYSWAPGRAPGDLPMAPWPMSEAAGETRNDSERDSRFHNAVQAYAKDNPFPMTTDVGTCPMCGHNDCFHEIPGSDGKWMCFSTDHSTGGRRHPAGYWGDVVDIHAAQRGLEPAEFLRQEGYLSSRAPSDRVQSEGDDPRLKENDSGNAARFISDHGDRVRYCTSEDAWYLYDGVRWAKDTRDAIVRLAKKTVDGIFRAAIDGSPERRLEAAKWSRRSGDDHRIRAMLRQAQPEAAVELHEFDADPNLLNLKNGTLDLETKSLRQHERGDLISKLVPGEFDADAVAPVFDRFLNRVLPDSQTRDFLQRALGQALCGEVTEQILFFMVGDGANGKTTLVEAIKHALGSDYARSFFMGLLMKRNSTGASPELVDLHGVRFAGVPETPERGRLDENIVKVLTGGDEIVARPLYKAPVRFPPSHSLFVTTNHLPIIAGRDYGIWRRVRVIEFEVRISDDERDPMLWKKLRDEAHGIIRWLVEGDRAYREMGLGTAPAVEAASHAYRVEEDHVERFCQESLEAVEDAFIASKEVHGAYLGWLDSQEEVEAPLSQRKLTIELKRKGLEYVHTRAARGFRGWDLREVGQECDG